MIQIIDYGMGNIGSIVNMLKKIGEKSRLVNHPDQLEDGQKIILPGVGAFDNAMVRLNESGFSEAIKMKAAAGTPLLGVCLGMQLLGAGSEEGNLDGLNIIPGKTRKLLLDAEFKIPHMGWNTVSGRGNNPLLKDLDINKFYFVHSYHFLTQDDNNSIGKTNYGLEFTCMVRKGKVFGAQFHPEKSHKYGMQMFKNFAAL